MCSLDAIMLGKREMLTWSRSDLRTQRGNGRSIMLGSCDSSISERRSIQGNLCSHFERIAVVFVS